MTTLSSPHDRFFKAVFGRTEVAAEFLARYLPPAVAAALDWATLRVGKDSFLDADLAQHPADLLYEVDLPGGGTGYVHILFEHKSYVETRIGLDLPAVSGADLGAMPARRSYRPLAADHPGGGLSRREGVAAQPAVCRRRGRRAGAAGVHTGLHLLSDRSEWLPGRRIAGRGHVADRAADLKYIFRDDLRERLPEILGLLRELEQSSSGLDYVITLLRYLAQGPSTERLNADELRRVATAVLSNEGELMTTIAEQWVQEGIEKASRRGS